MRNKKWLRYGLASAGIGFAALGAVLAACGDDDSGVTANQDAGNDNNVTPADSGNDTGTDGSTDSSTPTPAKIIAVHAATDYGPNHPTGVIRVCYATKTATDTTFTLSPLPPLPHSVEDGGASPFPGIPIGTGGPFPSTGLPLEGIAIKPYLINAQALAERGVVGTTGLGATARCGSLLKNGGFVPDGGFANDAGSLEMNKDYWELPEIPAGTFKNNKTYVLAIYGCTGDVDGTPATGYGGKCGPNTDGTGSFAPDGGAGPGNLKVVVMELDTTTTVAADEIGVQVSHLSPQYQAGKNLNLLSPFTPLIMNGSDAGPDPDGGAHYVSQTEIAFQATPTVTAMAKVKGFVSNKGYFVANENTVGGVGPFIPIAMNNSVGSLPSVQYIVEGKTAPNTAELYANGKTYTFVLVGDPNPPVGAVGATRKVHYLGFPNEFTPPPAQ